MDNTIGGWARGIVLALTLIAISACNMDGSSTGTNTYTSSGQPNGTPLNAAPQISGAPLDEAVVERTFSFQPSASDSDGDALRFTISSKPSWASFSSDTGRLSGTPQKADIGS